MSQSSLSANLLNKSEENNTEDDRIDLLILRYMILFLNMKANVASLNCSTLSQLFKYPPTRYLRYYFQSFTLGHFETRFYYYLLHNFLLF